MLITSKFKPNIVGPIIVIVMVVVMSVVITYLMMEDENTPLFVLVVYYVPELILVCIMIFGELRRRTIKVIIDSETITVRRYLGWGREKLYFLNQFEGFYTTELQSRYGGYEYLYLMKDNRKVIKLSEFYHANFQEMKAAISGKVKNFGPLTYNFWREVREFFE
jgi:hypothetical protein